jgi:hypothetical protein
MSMATPPTRDFTQADFEARPERAKRRVRDLEIDAELLSKPATAEMPVIR